ncbi:RluA family pseudouridine synthase [Domibacillus iocasae]|uniref:Pseudouridine synthase n=1 Tax=Domibacillus iocasae TaxID=1714016 RepID=A0A1E7DLW2_9BACI|nr:RluA family pseudouridine synthase [Domibacillus iocasae]OES43995.1 RNA pseudouridine synthase [Domibacillus iocasae]
MNTMRQGIMHIIQIDTAWGGLTIEDLFSVKWALPKKMIHTWRMEKSVLLNGQPADWRQPFNKHDRLSIPLFRPGPFGADPAYPPPVILYEDDHLLVADKPSGMKTHPNEPEENDTLLNGVCYHVSLTGETLPVRHVHRLDEGTSGAVLFAKHEAAYAVLSRLLEQKEIFRTYYAVVDGEVKKRNGVITKPIGKDRHHPSRRRISSNGQSAITHFKRVAVQDGKSLLECRLETGRTHQIRVHLASINHPITGDMLYGGSRTFSRPMLHAATLTIPNYFANDCVTVSAPVPNSIKKLFKTTFFE